MWESASETSLRDYNTENYTSRGCTSKSIVFSSGCMNGYVTFSREYTSTSSYASSILNELYPRKMRAKTRRIYDICACAFCEVHR